MWLGGTGEQHPVTGSDKVNVKHFLGTYKVPAREVKHVTSF